MTIVNSSGRLPTPMGYLLWCYTWVDTEHLSPGWSFPLCRAKYGNLTFPERAFDNDDEKHRVLGWISKLEEDNGFPKELDDKFRDLAVDRLKRHPWRMIPVMAKRILALWWHPAHSHGWPGP
ncbi:unnamed protein product, partial [marine sediment metagenome]